jgi:hypothetical protein
MGSIDETAFHELHTKQPPRAAKDFPQSNASRQSGAERGTAQSERYTFAHDLTRNAV